MSIVELLSSVDSIAKAIAKKNQEVDLLKQQLSEKLSILNTYLRNNESTLEYNTTIEQLNCKINCPNCQNTIWNNEDSQSPFVLVPKSKLSLPDTAIHDKLTNLNIRNEAQVPRNSATTSTMYDSSEKPKPKSKSKTRLITCSYCKQQGHTRAKCTVRLTTPIKDEK